MLKSRLPNPLYIHIIIKEYIKIIHVLKFRESESDSDSVYILFLLDKYIHSQLQIGKSLEIYVIIINEHV